jgi:hypothetical protein
MATAMSISMVAWMVYRRHRALLTVEMVAAMFAGFLVLLLPLWAHVISAGTFMVAAHRLDAALHARCDAGPARGVHASPRACHAMPRAQVEIGGRRRWRQSVGVIVTSLEPGSMTNVESVASPPRVIVSTWWPRGSLSTRSFVDATSGRVADRR